jgi:RNA polymerase sigma-70 factor (ECF subfamily)
LDRQVFDEEYVQRLTQGDPGVERDFTAYFGELLLIKLRGRLRSPQLIEDARQETFARVLAVLRRKGGLEHPERLGAFVNSVCNNILSEFFRANGRASPIPEDAPDPVDPGLSAESKLITEERKQRVRQTLAQLPEKDRKLLRSVFFEDRDKTEICSELNVDREYLRVLLHRAKSRFRASFVKEQTTSSTGEY